jgi:hypothetical protein
MNKEASAETGAPRLPAKSASAGLPDKTEEASFDATAAADFVAGTIWHDAVGKWQAVSGGPWELTLVLLLSATVFFSIWHFVAELIR